eukprot:scaffold497883_cov33-Prasinocladus_malaysianus.AAC.1
MDQMPPLPSSGYHVGWLILAPHLSIQRAREQPHANFSERQLLYQLHELPQRLSNDLACI